MPKKTVEQHLEVIELLIASIILKRNIDTKAVAKILGCSDNKITTLLPKKGKKNG